MSDVVLFLNAPDCVKKKQDSRKIEIAIAPYIIVGYVKIPDGRGHNGTWERSSQVSL